MRKTFYPKATNYSNGEINRLGKKLVDNDPDSSSTEYKEAFAKISDWRASHLYPMNTFRTTLIKKTRNCKNPIVAQRLKRAPTIIAKLRRFPTMSLSRMQDIGGLRAILNNPTEVYKLKSYYENAKLTHKLTNTYDYIKNPKPDGYRGVHLVFQYNGTNKIAKQYDGLLIEVQLRTKLQHTWATAVEVAGLMQGAKFKNDEGDAEWLSFFKYISKAFEVVEYLDNGEKYIPKPNYVPEEIYQTIDVIDNKHKILDKLRAFSNATQFINSYNFKGAGNLKYFIVEIDPLSHRTKIYGYSEREYSKAVRKYSELEEKHAQTPVDQVLVSVGSLKKLKIAYPNYFADMTDFVNKVKIIEKHSK